MIGITEIIYLGTFFALYREFGWSIYKRIGADRSVKKMYMWFQVFICVLKFGASCAFFPEVVLRSVDRFLLVRFVLVATRSSRAAE